MGCKICKNNDECLVEEEFKYPLSHQNSKKNDMNMSQNPDNILEKKGNLSSPNLKELKENINNNDKNKNGDEVRTKDDEDYNNNYNNNIKINNEKIRILNNKEEKESIVNQNKEIENKIDESKILSRCDPQKYGDIVFNNMQYISKEIKIESNDETGQTREVEEIFFQKKVKVKLNRGEKAFIEAAEYLKQLGPLKELINKDEIKLNIPDNPEKLNDNSFIKKQLLEIRKNNNINAFFKDTVKNPEVAVLLMIVGDYKDTRNKKRNALLNPNYKYIAVNSKFIGDLFISYYTFSK